MGKQKENYIFEAAAILIFTYFLLNKSTKAQIGKYPERKEQLLYDMINGVGDLNLSFTTAQTQAERKELLAKAKEFQHSNVDLIYKYNKPKSKLKKIGSSNDCYEELLKIVPQSELDRREFFVVLYLNRANYIIGYDLISLGGISSTVVDTQIILQKAILILATSMILCHNHPSGGLQPSSQDIDLTKKLQEALKLLNIKLLDHIIIADERSYYSFADEGRM
jgi:DNA repair protein RadC